MEKWTIKIKKQGGCSLNGTLIRLSKRDQCEKALSHPLDAAVAVHYPTFFFFFFREVKSQKKRHSTHQIYLDHTKINNALFMPGEWRALSPWLTNLSFYCSQVWHDGHSMLIPLFLSSISPHEHISHPWQKDFKEKKIAQSFFNSPFHAPFFLFFLQTPIHCEKGKIKMPLALRIKSQETKKNASLALACALYKMG